MLYTQISNDERKIIDYLFNVQRKTISFIAKELKRNKSTISREIKRNSIRYGNIDWIETWKAKKRQWHKHFMYNLKYPEFTNQFVKYYDKRCHGVEATYYKIVGEFLFIKRPSCHQLFN